MTDIVPLDFCQNIKNKTKIRYIHKCLICNQERSLGYFSNYAIKTGLVSGECKPCVNSKKRSPESIEKQKTTARTKPYKHPLEVRKKISEAKKKLVKEGKHNLFKDGKSSERKKMKSSMEWKDWRSAVFKRDNYTCQVCGVIGTKLHPHHIKPFSEFIELAFDVENGTTLCEPCHRKTDSYGWSSYWKNKLKHGK